MKMLRCNFEHALRIAMRGSRLVRSTDAGSPALQSSFTAGLAEVLRASERGEHIEIEPPRYQKEKLL